MKSLLPSILVLSLVACRSASEDAPPEAETASAYVPRYPVAEIDVEHYALDVELFPGAERIEAECTLRVYSDSAGPRTIALDFAGLSVTGVVDPQGVELEYVHEGARLYVTWPMETPVDMPVEFTVRYAGSPVKGLWWARSSGDAPDEVFVFTHGQCNESRWWFPCHDVPADRATSDLRVTMPRGWKSLAAGDRLAEHTTGLRTVEAWSMTFPHPTYLTTLVAGPLEGVESDWEGVPLSYLAPGPWVEHLGESLTATGPSLAYMSDLLGVRYPYTKYAQACVPGFPFGGMENITATTLTLDALSDESGLLDHRPDVLVAHEVAHQWIGNLVTIGDWKDIWIQEGLATYLSYMFLEETEGEEVFLTAMREKRLEYLAADRGASRRPIVYDVYRDPSDLFAGGHAYQGGATRFHLLRRTLGDQVFRTGLRRLIGDNLGASIDTADVRSAFERASGRDLEPFFEQWLLSPGYPEVETRWTYDASRERVILTVNQVQSIEDGTPSAFQAPVLVEVMGPTGAERVTVEMEKRRAKIEIPCEGEPRWVRFDKYRALPAEIRPDKGVAEWAAILGEDDDLEGRLEALLALLRVQRLAAEEKSDPNEEELERSARIEALMRKVLAEDPAEVVRERAAQAIAALGGDDNRAALERSVAQDDSLVVRRSSLEALAAWCPDAALVELAQTVFDDRQSWATMGAAARLRVAADPETGLAWVRARLTEPSPNEILRRHLLTALGGLPTESATEELVRWLEDEAAFAEVRAEAARQLARRAPGGTPSARRARRHLIGALEVSDGRLRRAVIESLVRVDDSETRSALLAYRNRTPYARERHTIEAALTQ